MEYRNDCAQINAVGFFQQQLHVYVLQFHSRLFLDQLNSSGCHTATGFPSLLLQLCAASMKSWASSIRYRLDSSVYAWSRFSCAANRYWANLPPANGSKNSCVS